MAVLGSIPKALLILTLVVLTNCNEEDDDLKDFEFSNPDEVMIAQESRQYQTFVKPPIRIIKPHGVTNSHRPQYNLDSLEEAPREDLEDFFGATTKRTVSVPDYRASHKLRAKEGMIKDAVLRALERKDHVGKFAQILPIIRAMSGNQRVALASLVASQVSTPPGRAPLNLAQVRSMFGNNDNTTSDLMLPILLDMANLIRRAVRSGKQQREVKQPLTLPQAQLLRRSFEEDTYLDDEPFDVGVKPAPPDTTTTKSPLRNRRVPPRNIYTRNRAPEKKEESKTNNEKPEILPSLPTPLHTNATNDTKDNIIDDDKNATKYSSSYSSSSSTTTTEASTTSKMQAVTSKSSDNSSLDLAAESTNQTLASDLPVAEKLRAFNRFIDRKGNLIRRGTYPPKPSQNQRRSTPEPTISPISRRRPPPARKLPVSVVDQGKCELFTNTLCLHSEDYPTELIVQSIRRNKAAAGALLADFKDPGEGALDGVTAAQEAQYTAEHYLQQSNRRGDTANRDFASAGEAGFMCPSTVKYARPQRARATSGQWKYIVNTGEHTQTLRLEKCLKPKESCTFLTDNFKSKCVQVYNYHRLLTWDQQNGLHMDIFKVPTCCSCHIEGYSVSFPPLGHRVHETSNENFPGEDLSAEHGNQAFEQVQQTIHRPTKTQQFHKKPLDQFPPFSDGHNLLAGSPFVSKMNDNDDNSNLSPSNPMDSYGNTYFPDSFNQASNIRNVKRPLSRNPIGQASNSFDQVTLPSYLEPPTPSAPASFSFTKENSGKYKQGNLKRGPRPNRRPIRKKIGGPEDLVLAGTSAVENLETMEGFNDDLEDHEVAPNAHINPAKRATIAPKLAAVTTERPSSTSQPEQKKNKQSSTTNKRVNYNYHPIIEYFEDEGKEEDNSSIDREDALPSFMPSPETEWKPINHPSSRNLQTSNAVGRKKHK